MGDVEMVVPLVNHGRHTGLRLEKYVIFNLVNIYGLTTNRTGNKQRNKSSKDIPIEKYKRAHATSRSTPKLLSSKASSANYGLITSPNINQSFLHVEDRGVSIMLISY
jgi:hypothetical protein